MGSSLKEYYSNKLDSPVLDYFKNNECKKLIKSKYSKIGKKAVFQVSSYDENIFAKDAHMVSVYYIGMLLEKLVSDHLANKFKQIVEDKIRNNVEVQQFYEGLYNVFDYLWCLVSLYHDVVAHYEWENCFDGTKFEAKDDYSHIKECIHKQFDYNIENLLIESGENFNLTHTSEVISKYFTFILNKVVSDERTGKRKNKLEHGILAGNILYDVLSKNLKNKLGFEKHIVDEDNLVWDKNDNLLYMYAADAIIAHNMWYVSKEDSSAQAYKDNGLCNLIYDSNSENDNRLNINDNPLAFLLGLVDTIEPIKYFCVVDGSKKGEIDKEKIIPILGDVFIQVDLGKKSIVISSNNLNLDKWYSEKIKDMEDWLKLSTEYYKESKKITIEIK